jgi:hypothetical protein
MGVLSAPGRSRKDAAEQLASARGVSVSDVLDSPFALVGDTSAIRDRIVELRERFGSSAPNLEASPVILTLVLTAIE